MGNVYIKFASEEEAEKCYSTMNGKYYNLNKIIVEYSPVTDFSEAKCRQYHEGSCDRGGYCNFIHPKHVDSKLYSDLTEQMYEFYPLYLEAKKE